MRAPLKVELPRDARLRQALTCYCFQPLHVRGRRLKEGLALTKPYDVRKTTADMRSWRHLRDRIREP